MCFAPDINQLTFACLSSRELFSLQRVDQQFSRDLRSQLKSLHVSVSEYLHVKRIGWDFSRLDSLFVPAIPELVFSAEISPKLRTLYLQMTTTIKPKQQYLNNNNI